MINLQSPNSQNWWVVRNGWQVTVEDNELPTITCPADVTVNTDASTCEAKLVVLGTEASNDNCTGSVVTNDEPLTYLLGNTTVLFTITDGSGNTATCSQLVTVEDNELPTITCPIDVTVNTDVSSCEATLVVLGTETSADNCTGSVVTNDEPSTYVLGNTTVLFTITDGSGNTATCSQVVTVEDNELPTIICPIDVTVNTDASTCETTLVVLGTETSADNCTGSVVTNNEPSAYVLVNTTVLFTITDGSGNTATCSQVVTVEDNELPTITCPADVTVNTDASTCEATLVVLGTETSADNCTGSVVTNNEPTTYILGNTTVLFTITDGSGNTATCSQIVTVEDNELPTITCPADVTVNTDASSCEATLVVLGTETSTDNCTGSVVTNDEPSSYVLGNTTVLFTITDGSGNTATCSQIVTVEDNELPTITCPADVTVNTDASTCEATLVVLGTETSADNCTGSVVTNNEPTTYILGNTTVLFTITDGSGNTATCSQIVTVEDNELPTITCPADVTVNTDASTCEATLVVLGTETSADNCTGSVVTNDEPSTYILGNTTVLFTITDGSGNTATCSQIVTCLYMVCCVF